MFHVLAKVQPSRRATPVIAALRFPIQSRGASCQTASCASTVNTRNSLQAFCSPLLIHRSMVVTMKRPTNFRTLGDVAKRAAARLTIDHEGPGKGPEITPRPVAKPVGQVSIPERDDRSVKGQQPQARGSWSGRVTLAPDGSTPRGPSRGPAASVWTSGRPPIKLRAVGPVLNGRRLN